jgi:hypothetical protein
MNVVFLAYRDWALEVYPCVKRHPKVDASVLCQTESELLGVDLANYDLLITCGWSAELGPDLVSKILAIGVHCAELDRYSYGTPLQNQIIDGVRFTRHRIFRFSWVADSRRVHTHTREYSHEVILDLSGNMSDILSQMASTAIALFNMFLDDYPHIVWKRWPEEDEVREARTPDDSILSREDIAHMNSEELYNFIRCLEHPYPNACLQDEVGILYFERVRYKRTKP